jgi:hypothetical protein
MLLVSYNVQQRGHEHDGCYVNRPLRVLSDPASMLFGLEAEFRVLSVCRTGPTAVRLIMEQSAREGPCAG